MEIVNCKADFYETMIYLPLAVFSELFLCICLSWNSIVIIGCVIIDLLLSISYIIDYFYLYRQIVLDRTGCSIVSKMFTAKYSWNEINVKYINNSSFLFGDSELRGKGIIISCHKISKPRYIGAMTYCRFTHPLTSFYIRFDTLNNTNKLKKNAARFVYGGFVANGSELINYLYSIGVIVKT